MLTTLTMIFAALAVTWTIGFLRVYPLPVLGLRTIPVTASVRNERDLIPPPLN